MESGEHVSVQGSEIECGFHYYFLLGIYDISMHASIYLMSNTVNDKQYIGSTTEPIKRRLQKHQSAARKGESSKLYVAMKEIGHEKFYVELLEVGEYESLDDLSNAEHFWINRYETITYGYNARAGVGHKRNYRQNYYQKLKEKNIHNPQCNTCGEATWATTMSGQRSYCAECAFELLSETRTAPQNPPQ